MNRQVQLIDHLPQFMQEYEEIKRLMNAEDPEFQAAFDASESTRNNFFVLSCDKHGIERFEKLLGISPGGDSLNTRKARVIIRLNNSLPVTYDTLVNKLDAVCGPGNYELSLDTDSYFLKIVTRFEVPKQSDEFMSLIREIIPANIKTQFNNDIDVSSQNTAYFGGVVQCCGIVQASDSGNIPVNDVHCGTAPCGFVQYRAENYAVSLDN